MVSTVSFAASTWAIPATSSTLKTAARRELSISGARRVSGVVRPVRCDTGDAGRSHGGSDIGPRFERNSKHAPKVVLQASTRAGGEESAAGGSVFDGELSVLEGGMSLTSLDYDSGRTGAGEVSGYSPKFVWFAESEAEERRIMDRGINGAIVGFSVAAALTKLCTVDHDYWAGWTLYEIIRNAPGHNWLAYEAMLSTNPVFAKMCISGVVYAVGDLSAQCYEGRHFLEFDRARVVRSGMVGFFLHGSLSHHYYHFCEWLFPFKEWWVVPVKVAFDQTIWSGLWNSIYYVSLGMLRFENPLTIFKELKATFIPLLTAGWKLWPFAHIITYGVMPVEQRLLWVDMIELVWVTILSMISNEKAETRKTDEQVIMVTEGGEGVVGVLDSEGAKRK